MAERGERKRGKLVRSDDCVFEDDCMNLTSQTETSTAVKKTGAAETLSETVVENSDIKEEVCAGTELVKTDCTTVNGINKIPSTSENDHLHNKEGQYRSKEYSGGELSCTRLIEKVDRAHGTSICETHRRPKLCQLKRCGYGGSTTDDKYLLSIDSKCDSSDYIYPCDLVTTSAKSTKNRRNSETGSSFCFISTEGKRQLNLTQQLKLVLDDVSTIGRDSPSPDQHVRTETEANIESTRPQCMFRLGRNLHSKSHLDGRDTSFGSILRKVKMLSDGKIEFNIVRVQQKRRKLLRSDNVDEDDIPHNILHAGEVETPKFDKKQETSEEVDKKKEVCRVTDVVESVSTNVFVADKISEVFDNLGLHHERRQCKSQKSNADELTRISRKVGTPYGISETRSSTYQRESFKASKLCELKGRSYSGKYIRSTESEYRSSDYEDTADIAAAAAEGIGERKHRIYKMDSSFCIVTSDKDGNRKAKHTRETTLSLTFDSSTDRDLQTLNQLVQIESEGNIFTPSPQFRQGKRIQSKCHLTGRFTNFDSILNEVKVLCNGKLEMNVGIDLTMSNYTRGQRTFDGKCLHDLTETKMNPYRKIICLLGQTFEELKEENSEIQVFGVWRELLLIQNKKEPCRCFMDVLEAYHETLSSMKLGGTSNFAPLIQKAVQRFRKTKCLLFILTNGQLSKVDESAEALVEAASCPVFICAIGVGDGPWDVMEGLGNRCFGREFHNYHFVNYQRYTDTSGTVETDVAEDILRKLSKQNRKSIRNC